MGTPAETFALTVGNCRAEARDVVVLELQRPDAAPLPAFAPGAHLDVRLPNGLVRQYSIANDCRDRQRYVLGILREAPGHGRGGSEYVHRSLAAGVELQVTGPINNFELDPGAGAYRFIAGGIGITPILSMLQWCRANGRPWHLVYATRSRCRCAFYEALHQLDPNGSHVTWHFDDEAGHHLDAARALQPLSPGELVYCCGPRPLMGAVREQLADRPGVARFESFLKAGEKSPSDAAAAATAERAFTVTLRRSGRSLAVPADKSILEVLEDNGISVPFSCREGECGTCVTQVCEGVPEHRDFVLTDAERASNRMMCLCVSRAKTGNLVLDL
ncbi:MAG TPA: PDR/VanB family oxidoreductase [Rhodanobacteraceae bacterium]